MHSFSIKLFTLSMLVIALLLSGCESARDREEAALLNIDSTPHANLVKQAQKDWSWISGVVWRVTSIEGRAPTPDTFLWIEFKDHTWLTGSTGCNHISAGYQRRGIDGLKVSNIAATKVHCGQPAGIMQQESRFLHLLENIDAYLAEPDKLILTTNGISMLTFEPLHTDKSK